MFGTNHNVFQLILPTLQSPRELERLSPAELNHLAGEIRDELCRLYDHRSVHFASNLGVVELCIALHTVFDFSWDRLIWDTGHQIYPHKLLTGRAGQFHTIRTKGGLMGFPNPEESEYDLMMTGHAGCSVGTALGLCCGDDLIAGPNKRHSVAVIGDGAFSSGVVYEAMNHAGGLRKNLTVILNDNKMSICPRVGGLSEHLDRFRLHPYYQRFKQKLHWLVDRTPVVGESMDSLLGRFKRALKVGLHGGMFVEDFGFRYIGPIDGHNIPRLQRFLRMARSLEEPVLLHIFTEKGRGFEPAEQNPTAYHAPSPGRWIRDEADSASISLTELEKSEEHEETEDAPEPAPFTAFVRDALGQMMRKNDRLCVITAAMCQGNMLEPIREEFPERFFDVAICESHAVIFAAGLAKAGMLPVVDIYSTFLQRAYDQIFQEVSLQNLPVIFTIDRAGLAGPDGPTHHGVFDIAYLRPFPNLVIMAPADASDVEPMLRFAEKLERPVAIRYPKANTTPLLHETHSREPQPIELGKAEVIRPGRDGMIAVCGPFLETACEAAKTLGKNLDGLGRVDLGVINARFVKPPDTETILQPLRDGGFLVTIEEGMLAGGFGSAVLEAAAEEGLDTRRLRRFGVPDRYVEHGERNELLDDLGLNEANIVRVCREIMFYT